MGKEQQSIRGYCCSFAFTLDELENEAEVEMNGDTQRCGKFRMWSEQQINVFH